MLINRVLRLLRCAAVVTHTPLSQQTFTNPHAGDLLAAVKYLVVKHAPNPESRATRLVEDLMVTFLKMLRDNTGLGERKLLTRSFKELRHAFRVFAEYSDQRKVSIFGSA